jgi:hypothetical protein
MDVFHSLLAFLAQKSPTEIVVLLIENEQINS